MKKRVVFIAILMLAFMHFLSAEHTAAYSDGASSVQVNKNDVNVYNISITNIGSGVDSSINQVIIKFPILLSLSDNSMGTDAKFDSNGSSSDGSETTIFWSSPSLINGSETKNFWFSANATAYANYTITIITINSSVMSISYLTVVAGSSNMCTANWSCSQFSLCSNETQTRTCTDLNSCGDESSKPAENQTCSACTPNWQCSDFSLCSNGFQIRTCIDTNSCGDESSKPAENQTCSACTTKWTCSDWTPTSDKCPKSQIQTRTCTDENNCNDISSKPEETKTCEYQSKAGLIFTIIAVILGFASAFVLFLIIKMKIKK